MLKSAMQFQSKHWCLQTHSVCCQRTPPLGVLGPVQTAHSGKHVHLEAIACCLCRGIQVTKAAQVLPSSGGAPWPLRRT